MRFEELLEETKYSTSETLDRLIPRFIESSEYQKMQERYVLEKRKLQDKYPNISNSEEIMRAELFEYLLKLIPAIKDKYGEYIPFDRMQKLDGLLNPKNIVVINNSEDKHDFSADSEKGQIIINLSKIACGDSKDIYDKLVTAKGGLPHEIFHLIIKMLKSSDLADERMVINLSNGNTITSRGMVGFMLNEGFVEKLSSEFCSKQEQLYPGEYYYSVAPQYIPYVNICNYIMKTNSNINEKSIFSINYDNCLSGLSKEQIDAYKKAECVGFAVRHGKEKINREIKFEEVLSTRVDKITLESSFENMSKEQLTELRNDVVLSAQDTAYDDKITR